MGRPKKTVSKSIVIVEQKETDMLVKLAELTGPVTAKTVEAWNVLTTGVVAPGHLKERPGYPDPVKYVNHTYAQRLMNEAFKWNWDFEVLSYQLHADGSATSRCQMTIHLPIGINKQTNEVIWKDRVITEIGAFEGYKKGEKFTMSEADRVASSASRGLVKCMERAFNVGSDLKDVEGEKTQLDAWNDILRFGTNQGLSKETIVQIIKDAGVTSETLLENFDKIYKLIYNKAKGVETSVPLE